MEPGSLGTMATSDLRNNSKRERVGRDDLDSANSHIVIKVPPINREKMLFWAWAFL
jgi:hypothetical protein